MRTETARVSFSLTMGITPMSNNCSNVFWALTYCALCRLINEWRGTVVRIAALHLQYHFSSKESGLPELEDARTDYPTDSLADIGQPQQAPNTSISSGPGLHCIPRSNCKFAPVFGEDRLVFRPRPFFASQRPLRLKRPAPLGGHPCVTWRPFQQSKSRSIEWAHGFSRRQWNWFLQICVSCVPH